MATRFEGTYYSITNEKYIVQINDTDFVGTALSGELTSLRIQYEGEGGERFQPILGASITIGLQVDSTDLETFVTDMVGAEEGRFVVVINQVAVNNLYQVGYILPDLITLPDSKPEVAYSVELKATDGIARLKTIDYNNAGSPYTGYATFTSHIFNCLNKLPAITGLYSAFQAFFRVVCNWREDTRTYNVNENPLDYARCNHVAFYNIDSKGNYNYKSCYDVLSEICKAFGARMMYSDGKFWFIQINEMGVPAGKTVYNYRTDQSSTILSSQDFRISNAEADLDTLAQVKRLSGGVFKYYPALRKAAVKYSHRSTVNMLAGKTIDKDTSAITYETVDAYGGTAKLNYTGTLRITVDSAVSATFPVWAIFEVTIKVGTNQYLAYYGSFSGGRYVFSSASPPTWSASASVYELPIEMGLPDYEFVFPINILTPEIPGSGDLEFDIAFGGLFDSDGNGISFGDTLTTWVFENNYLELLGIGAFSGQADVTEYWATNDADANSAMLEVDTILGDGPGLTSPGHIMVLDDLAVWRITDAWRIGNSGTYKNISQLLVNEIIRGQLTPITKYLGTIIKWDDFGNGVRYDAQLVLDWYGRYFLFNGGTFDLATDTVQGEWFELDLETTGYTEQTPIDRPANSPSSSSPSGSAGSPGSGGGSGTTIIPKYFRERFASFSGSSITITVNSGVLPSNKDQIIVFFNGRDLDHNEWTYSGAVITFTFTMPSIKNAVVFFITQ